MTPFSRFKARPLTRAALAAFVLFTLQPASAQDEHGHREADAHVHGAVDVAIVLEGGRLTVELASPLWNLVGFEHAPATDAEKLSWRKAAATLGKPERVIALPAAARCRPSGQKLGPFTQGAKAAPHDDHAHHANAGGSHAGHTYRDASLGWTFSCRNPAALTSATLTLFGAFPTVEKASVLMIAGTKQTAATLTPKSPAIRVR